MADVHVINRPGGSGGSGGPGPASVVGLAALAILGLTLLVGLATSFYVVEPEGRAVVTRFGRVADIKDPGLHFLAPFWIDRAHFVPTERILKEEFGFRTRTVGDRTAYDQSESHLSEALMLTGDLNVLEVQWVVQYRVKDPERFLHQVDNPIRTIRDVSESVMRRIVGNRLASDVLTVGRVSVATGARDEIQRILDQYEMGVHINTVELQDVTPPEPVKPAFNEVNEARQERERLINEAEKRRNQELPRARGEAQQLLSEAEGYAAERVNRALGEAARFTAIAEQYRQSPDVTRRRLYLETLDQVLPKAGQVLVVEPGSASPLPLMDLDKRRGGQ